MNIKMNTEEHRAEVAPDPDFPETYCYVIIESASGRTVGVGSGYKTVIEAVQAVIEEMGE